MDLHPIVKLRYGGSHRKNAACMEKLRKYFGHLTFQPIKAGLSNYLIQDITIRDRPEKSVLEFVKQNPEFRIVKTGEPENN